MSKCKAPRIPKLKDSKFDLDAWLRDAFHRRVVGHSHMHGLVYGQQRANGRVLYQRLGVVHDPLVTYGGLYVPDTYQEWNVKQKKRGVKKSKRTYPQWVAAMRKESGWPKIKWKY